MSRTKKGSKSPGYEYWGKRPMSGSNPGAWAKKVTHKIERHRGEAETRKAAKADDGATTGKEPGNV